MFLLVVLGVKIRALCMLRKTAKFRKIIKICLRNFLFVKGDVVVEDIPAWTSGLHVFLHR